ncbi:ABC transporter family protein [Tritrichomonas foetus]|uniref:ABC transporter family protein n=1 Tax=Tritrichomonas foetus TaxID=1144522 RepID=A0A1J4K7P4_9EUKA|nr:ABC transporter family protein [Tritrichomonas foetus]|eukprot:OHT06904.1 ABC transporter family protein [Tritrichomonas foetus]
MILRNDHFYIETRKYFQWINSVNFSSENILFFFNSRMESNHLRAILFRRWTLFKRSYKSIVISTLLALLFTVLAIVANYLMKALLKDKVEPIRFTSFLHVSDQIVISGADNYTGSDNLINILNQTFFEDVGKYPNFIYFDTRDELNEWMYDNVVNKTGPEYITMGVGFNNEVTFLNYTLYNNITGFYNGSWVRNELTATRVNLMRMLWKSVFGIDTDFTYSITRLMEKMKDFMFGALAPMLITCGLASIVPIIISQPIIDVNGEVRQYMISCSLKLFPYWIATFIIDITIWIILVNCAWIIYFAFGITAITDNLFNTWYAFMMTGPSFILFVYCCSFMFSSAESGTRQMFLILIILLLVPLFVDIITQNETPQGVNWVYAFFPHIGIQRILTEMLVRVNILKQNLTYYFKEDKVSQIYLVMQILDIPLYAIMLGIIEKIRIWMHKKVAKAKYGSYGDFFNEAKAKHPVTEEAREMERNVKESSDYAVRIIECSRLFFNTSGDPIPAVNNVSLGVKENSIFGFLGANGAGKTTLIKMITSMLPPSAGKIEINGVDINENNDCQILSICPQFNSHLCGEMTPREHFKLYRLLHKLREDEAQEHTNKLIETLELTPHADKTVRELSGGNQRKLALALSFYGPAKIVLLDEPTSSLDPVARRHVHDMIKEHRGQKTFMLCTHLLSEAESLCDNISIMIKGCVYTCGTPQYLSQKFGTEFKIDVMLKDDLEENNMKCDQFFKDKLPEAKLSILRPKVRIYSIPSNVITLSELFNTMEEGLEGENGFVYYTCSSSSLESVFMEIVHLSENDDILMVKDTNITPP